MSSSISASVIISTYNQPKWLELVLFSYELQSTNTFEIIIADDGSDVCTKKVIEDFCKKTALHIKHVWQENKGFQKTRILNKAIEASTSNYLIFTDGDCIARKDFVETHLKLKKPSIALSGGYFKLTERISNLISKEIIETQQCFDKKWLIRKGQTKNFKLNKLTSSRLKANFLNTLTPTKATFDGMNVSCWKKDIVAVNGFDERMKYGGEDREVGERMMNNGIRFKQVRYSTICVHLYHDRPYKDSDSEKLNKKVRLETKKGKSKWTNFGLKKST